MDWVHCNNCFVVPDTGRTFYITSCGHIYCQSCEEQCARGKCKLCGNQCSAILLSSTMKPDVQKFFADPDELLKKKLKEVQQVSEFQKNHRARLVAHQRKQMKKFDSVKQDFRKLLKNLKDVDSERRRVLQENSALKKVIKLQSPMHGEYSSKTERNHSKTSPCFNNNTPLSSLINKFDGSKAQNVPHRVCVISPPRNGRLGVIQGTPSPSSCLRDFHLSSNFSNESHQSKLGLQSYSPMSPASSISQSVFATPITPSTYSPNDTKRSGDPLKRKKLLVHPFSPNE